MAVDEVPGGQQPTPEIDRSSAIPLYHQLEYLLRREIDSGRYPPGSSLPSEGEIGARFGVSRSVIRQTLTNLANAGLIRTERGRGSFVAERKLQERFVQGPTGLYDDLRRMGYSFRTVVTRQEMTQLPLPAQEFLGVDRGIQLDRIRSVDGRTLAFIRSYLREELCPGLDSVDLEDRSLYAALDERYGLRPRSGRRTVESVAAEGEIAASLGVKPGQPLLLLRSSSSDENGEPLEWFEAWHRADRTAFEIEIVPDEHDRPVSDVVVGVDSPATGHPERVATPDELAQHRTETGLRDALRSCRVVAGLRAGYYQRPGDVTRALVDHGFPVVQYSVTGANALDAIAEAAAVEGAVVGAGGVLDASVARDAVVAGAAFLVAPIPAFEITGVAAGVPVILSGLTPSEIWSAWQATGDPVAVFPATLGGPGYLSSLRAAMPAVPLLAAGGVDETAAAAFLLAGVEAVSVDDALCPAASLEAGDVGDVARRAGLLRAAIDDHVR